MACGARWGLRLSFIALFPRVTSWLNGLWCPLGIETCHSAWYGWWNFWAKWPVVPVGD